ncbi:MAG: aminotransferase class V-fold PLP-dependent enzyme [Lachnospiraceae bacterium]
MIYLDNAATTWKKPPQVMEAVVYAMGHMGNAGRGSHGSSLDASRIIYQTREQLSKLFGLGNPFRVAFTANSTESLNMAIKGTLCPGDHVVTTVLEHNSVLRPLYQMRESGLELTILPADEKGNISLADMEQAIRKNTRAVVCTHASNLTGNMIDIGRVGALARKKDLLFIVDASQSAGVFPIHMKEMGIHILCVTGHKSLMGPQGLGAILVAEGVGVRPLVVGGSGVHSYSETHPDHMPEALEAGTLNGHGIAGLHAALAYIEEMGMDQIRERELGLMWQLYKGLSAIPMVKIYGDFTPGKMRAPIVTFNIGDYDSGEVADELSERFGIASRAGAHCAPLMHRSLGTAEQGAVRFSISHFNTEEEIDQAIEAVRQLAAE